MARITSAQYEPAFDIALSVKSEIISKAAAVALLSNSTELKASSSDFYISSLIAMFDGIVYKKTISLAATSYYLERFYKDMSCELLERALLAVELHLDYYLEQGNGDQVSIRKLVELYKAKFLSLTVSPVYPDEVDNLPVTFMEGGLKQVTINAYERDTRARAVCIEEFGSICQVCDFNFEAAYGEVGKGFIHVHHKVDIATIGKNYQVDPIKDLVPVCPNCHAMLHTETPAMKVEILTKLLKSKSHN